MEKICIFTDSSSDIPREEVEAFGIEIIPILVTANGKTFREYFDITPEEYWKLLRESEEIPATAQTTVQDCMEVFRRARQAGCTHAMGIMINGAGSGSFQAANIAKEMFYAECGEDMCIEILDSETYTYIYGRIVVEAAREREAGVPFAQIVEHAKQRIKCSEAYLGVFSLKHLQKSGRISGGLAFVGGALGMRPLSHVYAGSVDVCAKTRGDRNVPVKLVQLVMKRVKEPERQTAVLLYTDCPAEIIDQTEQLLRESGFADVQRYPIGCAVTTNTGPDAIAVAYYGAPRK
ncbi:MAG: DegV family protein [Butyricicoccaceae bacterium]